VVGVDFLGMGMLMNIRALFYFGTLSFFMVLPSLLLADEAMKCVQSQLNDLGYDAGAPDGQIGKKTKAAAQAYITSMKENNPGWNMPLIEPSNARFWCEKVADAWPQVNSYWVALKYASLKAPKASDAAIDGAAAPSEVSGELLMNVVIDKGANFEIAVLKAGAVTWQSGDFGRVNGKWAVPIPKSVLADADQICYALEPGWVVIDQAGKPFQVSCQPIPDVFRPILLSASDSTYEMSIQKADN
jgi:hypothetical protein